jgi:hypothetical protein
MTAASKMADHGRSGTDSDGQREIAAIAKFWKQAEPHLAKIRPHLKKLLPLLFAAGTKAVSLSHQFLTPFNKEGVAGVMWNVILVFFGGQFALTIMAMQAFELTGSVVIENSLKQLRQQYHEAMVRFHNDPDAKGLFDSNQDGDVSMEEVSAAVMRSVNGETVGIRDKSRKLVSICMRCIDPYRLSEAVSGFLMGSLAVIATLRSRLAKNVAMGTMIGQNISVFLRAQSEKGLYEKFPQHREWVDVGFKTGEAVIGIIISFTLTRVINAFTCALQGAESLTGILLAYAHRRGKLLHLRQGDKTVQAFTVALLFVGVMTQLRSRFALPWYIKLTLLPAVISETLLSGLALV